MNDARAQIAQAEHNLQQLHNLKSNLETKISAAPTLNQKYSLVHAREQRKNTIKKKLQAESAQRKLFQREAQTEDAQAKRIQQRQASRQLRRHNKERKDQVSTKKQGQQEFIQKWMTWVRPVHNTKESQANKSRNKIIDNSIHQQKIKQKTTKQKNTTRVSKSRASRPPPPPPRQHKHKQKQTTPQQLPLQLPSNASITTAVTLGVDYSVLRNNYKQNDQYTVVNEGGENLAHLACTKNHVETLKGLLKISKAFKLRSSKNKTLELLLWGKDDDGATALHHAVRSNSVACVRVLLEFDTDGVEGESKQSADVKLLRPPVCVVQDKSGWSPLHLAMASLFFGLRSSWCS